MRTSLPYRLVVPFVISNCYRWKSCDRWDDELGLAKRSQRWYHHVNDGTTSPLEKRIPAIRCSLSVKWRILFRHFRNLRSDFPVQASPGAGGGITPYNALYGEVPPERGTFFNTAVKRPSMREELHGNRYVRFGIASHMWLRLLADKEQGNFLCISRKFTGDE